MIGNGAVAVITGGTRGIGRALCEVLVERGATVYSCGTSENAPSEVPEGVVAIQCDVTDPADVRRLAELAGGEVDLLVNNAGVLGPRDVLEEVALDEWRHVFAVNVDGPFLVTNAFLPALRSAGGVVVNVSSSVGRRGRASWGPYACSKHALEGMTTTYAEELADDGVAVFAVNPGGTATDMRAEAFPDEDPDTLPTATEVAEVIVNMAERRPSGESLDVRDEL